MISQEYYKVNFLCYFYVLFHTSISPSWLKYFFFAILHSIISNMASLVNLIHCIQWYYYHILTWGRFISIRVQTVFLFYFSLIASSSHLTFRSSHLVSYNISYKTWYFSFSQLTYLHDYFIICPALV